MNAQQKIYHISVIIQWRIILSLRLFNAGTFVAVAVTVVWLIDILILQLRVTWYLFLLAEEAAALVAAEFVVSLCRVMWRLEHV